MSGRTKDELFLLCAYEEATKLGDVNALLDRYAIGRKSGLSERGTNAICNELMRSNFIKRIGEHEMRLTSNGEDLAKRLLGE